MAVVFFSLTQPINGDGGTQEGLQYSPLAAEPESILVPERNLSAMVITEAIYSP